MVSQYVGLFLKSQYIRLWYSVVYINIYLSTIYKLSIQSLDGKDVERRERILAEQNWTKIRTSILQVQFLILTDS